MKKLALILAVMFLPPMSEAFEGFVQMESGAPVSGAQVMLFDLEDLHAVPQTATTDPSGHFTLTTSALPEGFSLGDNYPNPFNPSTLIPYQLLAPMHVRLDVFNVLGQRIKTLVNGHQPVGPHTVRWDATDARGQAVGAGVYLYRLSAEGVKTTRSMLLIDGGIPLRPGGGFISKTTEKRQAYGLVVFASGLVPYVNPHPGASLEIALETPPSQKVAVNRILGDLDDNGIVDFSDVLLVVLYRRNASTSPDTNIMLGDVNGDGEIDGTDVRLISKYVKDPTDPTLPIGIGQPVETDLLLGSFSISDSTLTPNQIFTLTASVSNQGTLGMSQTTLRWYRSIDQTISPQDTEVGSNPVSSLAAGGTITESIELTAPSNEDTHYYGACVASISDETDTQNNCSSALRVSVSRPPPGFAPEDQAAFNQRMVGKSIHLLTFSIDLVSAGRFTQEGVLPGSYIYFNTGSHTGTLNLTYDRDHYGGSCSLQLTFDSTTTGTLNFRCASGIEGQNVWRLSEIGTPIAPIVAPISSSRMGARFQDIFETGETRAYDWQIRRKGPREPWISLCGTFSNEGRRNILSPVQLFSGLDPGTTYEIRYRYRNSSRCKEGRPGPWSEIGEGTIFSEEEYALRFLEGESTTRLIPENLPPNINLGDPVSAVAADSLRILTYTLDGPDAERFFIDAETGQLRTWEYYDYERKNQYTVTVEVEDDRGNSDSIEVIIEIADLAPFCGESSDFNLRTRSSDKGLTLRWDPLEDRQGHAQVLGYQTEIRIGAGGEWDGRRTLFGNDISGTIYAELTNREAYHVRIRSMNAEEECNWSTPASGIPTDNLAPKNAVDIHNALNNCAFWQGSLPCWYEKTHDSRCPDGDSGDPRRDSAFSPSPL